MGCSRACAWGCQILIKMMSPREELTARSETPLRHSSAVVTSGHSTMEVTVRTTRPRGSWSLQRHELLLLPRKWSELSIEPTPTPGETLVKHRAAIYYNGPGA